MSEAVELLERRLVRLNAYLEAGGLPEIVVHPQDELEVRAKIPGLLASGCPLRVAPYAPRGAVVFVASDVLL